MQRREYSAGAVKLAFWFAEFRKAVTLLASGETEDNVKRRSADENLFCAPTPARAKQICSTVLNRVRNLDESFYPIFTDGDLSSQKMVNLAAVMASDTLFFEFVYEVIREKMIIGTNEFTDADVRIFFQTKQAVDERVAGWTDVTLNRLGRSYKTMLYEAGMTDGSRNVRKITKPILDPALARWLCGHEMEPIYRAIAGER